ncbi:MAG: hypothetical protein LBM08_12090 [Dysgonamonadaceae bacterium]|jgi:hypothetical protein|nr:hypothetical protein [Dysgonamonadaceae bacterium]
MKTIVNLVSVAALAAAMMMSSCKKDDNGNEVPVEKTIALNNPADEATLDANTVTFPYEFTWTTIPEVAAYTIKFAPSEAELASTAIAENVGNAGVYSLDEATCEEWLAGAGVAQGASTTLYWTVVPTVDDPTVQTQVRSFTAVRLRYEPYTKLSTSEYAYQFSDKESSGEAGSDWSNMVNLFDGNYTTFWTSYMTANFAWWIQDRIAFTVPGQVIDRIKFYRPAGNTDPMTVTIQFAHEPYESLRYGFDGNEVTFQAGEDVVTIDVPEGTINEGQYAENGVFKLIFLTVSRPENGPMNLSEIECYQKK